MLDRNIHNHLYRCAHIETLVRLQLRFQEVATEPGDVRTTELQVFDCPSWKIDCGYRAQSGELS
ncbi:hypothetical protein CSW53_23915 [Rhodococcus ruber]|jgi:hypothetical protein|nr:hypothetical protein CSW53_23915 [Rhodococcus ruber]